jgi:hypothetical protein
LEWCIRELLHSETLPVDFAIDDLNIDLLRRQFSGLLDRAALAVNRAGLDLDDVIVERYLLCSNGRDPVIPVAAEPLGNRAGLLERIRDGALTPVGEGLPENRGQSKPDGTAESRPPPLKRWATRPPPPLKRWATRPTHGPEHVRIQVLLVNVILEGER